MTHPSTGPEPVDRPAPSARRRAGLAALVGLLYFAAALVSMLMSRLPDNLAAIWIADAIVLAILLRLDRRLWVACLLAVLAAGTAAKMLVGDDLVVGLGVAGACVVEIWLAAAIVRRWHGPEFRLDGPVPYLNLQIVAAVVAPLIGGGLTAAALYGLRGEPVVEVWRASWTADVIGAILVLPIALTLSREAVRQTFAGRRLLEFLAIATATIGATWFVIGNSRYPLVVMTLPLGVAAMRATPLAMALISGMALCTVVAAHLLGFLGSGVPAGDFLGASPSFYASLALFMPFCISLLIEQLRRERSRIAESEKRFRNAMEHSAIGMALVGLDGRWLRINRALSEMLGYGPGELTSLTFQDITHPEDIATDLELLKRALDGEIDNYRMEKRYLRKDGSLMWALLAVSLVRDEATGAPLHFISQIEDITARKRAEEAIEKSENRWNFALESARQGVWDHDIGAGRTFYSSMWKGMLGYRDDEIDDDSETWWTFVHPDDVATVRSAGHEHVVNDTPNFECEFRMRHKAGHWVWILGRGKVIERDADGRPLRMIGTHTDITARKEAEEQLRLMSERMQLAVTSGRVGLWERNLGTGKLWWDDRMYEIYGLSRSEDGAAYDRWVERLHPDDRERVETEVRAAISGGKPYDTEFRAVTPAGEVRYVRTMASRIVRSDGTPWLLSGTNLDVTENHRLTDALFEEKERLKVTLRSIGDAVIATDTQANVTFMNPVAEELTGWSAAEALGQPAASVVRIVDESSDGPVDSPVEECMRLVRPISRQESAVLVGRGGERRDIRESAAPVRTASGEVIGAVLVFQDMTRSRQLQRELAHSAAHDALTGLPNRSTFESELTATCAGAVADRRQHALCFIDLDRFKIVNDTVGHAAGDALLREIGRVITKNVRANDTTARLGGDEFALLLRDCAMGEAELVARKVVEAIRSIPFAWGGRVYDVGASIGMTEISERSPPPSELLSQADVACYAAKAMGRNRVAVYQAGESDAHRHHRDLQVAANIRGAIEDDHFRLFAQEIRSLGPHRTGTRHIELLLRLDDNGRLIEPSAFIPAAERYDLMANIDRWVVRAALGRYGERIRAEGDLSISINLSANSLNDPLFWPFLREELGNTQIPANHIHFEITETALINNLSAAHALVSAARQAGCAIVLDDFGTGLSSFAYLKRFPVDYVKIDGSFMQSLRENGVDRSIVESINDIAHKLGARTVAECVEDGEAIEVLREIGVDEVQGFAISEPRPIEAFLSPQLREVSAA